MVSPNHEVHEVPRFGSDWLASDISSVGLSRARRQRVGLVGTYPPTECGIATFTANVRDAILTAKPHWDVEVVRLVDARPPVADATLCWVRNDSSSLEEVVDVLNDCDMVVIQHEFGIFGGRDGDEVLDLVGSLRVPVVVTLHTVLQHPSAHQRFVVQGLLDVVDLAIVPSRAALDRLHATYSARHAVVVPHGAVSNFASPARGERPVVLTWGLLGPGKGIEHAIHAVSLLRDEIPNLRYVIAGHTHPNLCLDGTDPYRESLKELVSLYGVEDLVEFNDRYLDWDSLRALVRGATVVLLPYQSRDQISSGVLVEALASGRPVVATRFPHAVELLADGAGILVDFDDAPGLARALRRIVAHPDVARAMGERSRRVGMTLLWPRVGLRLGRLIEEISGRARIR